LEKRYFTRAPRPPAQQPAVDSPFKGEKLHGKKGLVQNVSWNSAVAVVRRRPRLRLPRGTRGAGYCFKLLIFKARHGHFSSSKTCSADEYKLRCLQLRLLERETHAPTLHTHGISDAPKMLT